MCLVLGYSLETGCLWVFHCGTLKFIVTLNLGYSFKCNGNFLNARCSDTHDMVLVCASEGGGESSGEGGGQVKGQRPCLFCRPEPRRLLLPLRGPAHCTGARSKRICHTSTVSCIFSQYLCFVCDRTHSQNSLCLPYMSSVCFFIGSTVIWAAGYKYCARVGEGSEQHSCWWEIF